MNVALHLLVDYKEGGFSQSLSELFHNPLIRKYIHKYTF